jgi:predicted amidophosphoribosyltransferase
LFDDRVFRILEVMSESRELDIREIVLQRESRPAAHEREEPRSVSKLVENYYIDENMCEPPPEHIIIFDDILTTGAHFKAVQQVLLMRFGNIPVAGLFVARRAPQTTDI